MSVFERLANATTFVSRKQKEATSHLQSRLRTKKDISCACNMNKRSKKIHTLPKNDVFNRLANTQTYASKYRRHVAGSDVPSENKTETSQKVEMISNLTVARYSERRASGKTPTCRLRPSRLMTQRIRNTAKNTRDATYRLSTQPARTGLKSGATYGNRKTNEKLFITETKSSTEKARNVLRVQKFGGRIMNQISRLNSKSRPNMRPENSENILPEDFREEDVPLLSKQTLHDSVSFSSFYVDTKTNINANAAIISPSPILQQEDGQKEVNVIKPAALPSNFPEESVSIHPKQIQDSVSFSSFYVNTKTNTNAKTAIISHSTIQKEDGQDKKGINEFDSSDANKNETHMEANGKNIDLSEAGYLIINKVLNPTDCNVASLEILIQKKEESNDSVSSLENTGSQSRTPVNTGIEVDSNLFSMTLSQQHRRHQQQEEKEEIKKVKPTEKSFCNDCNENKTMEIYGQNKDVSAGKTIEKRVSLPPGDPHTQERSQMILSTKLTNLHDDQIFSSTFSAHSDEYFTAPQLSHQQEKHEELSAVNRSNNVSKSREASLTKSQEEKRKRTMNGKRQNRLFSLLHATQCHQNNFCRVPDCAAMKNLWKHMGKCHDNKCKVPQCYSSRYILSHFHSCKNVECEVCIPVRKRQQKDSPREFLIVCDYAQNNISSVTCCSSLSHQTSSRTISSIKEE